ncbi:Aluminum-activated malate transporter - like 10, partial [Theobroma cacao]
MGLALTLVSVFYYFQPVYDGFGDNAMWAVLTVVVVFEFSVGATLGKGLNRMLATLTAGALALGAHRIATLSGRTGEPILISTFVFITGSIVTFMKFIPKLKARFDYGMTIFILTFCLVSVSGYRDDQVLEMAHERVTTIIIGSCISIFVCVCIYPVWIGEDLHKLVSEEETQTNDSEPFLQAYKSVLTSKSSEETMANLARWEPGHGRFRFHHPWKNYLKIGNLTRECAYKISLESSKALKELASTIRKMTRTRSADPHIANSKTAAEELKTLLKTTFWEEEELLQILPAVSVASLLLEIVECAEKIAEAVYELAKEASFKRTDATFHRG